MNYDRENRLQNILDFFVPNEAQVNGHAKRRIHTIGEIVDAVKNVATIAPGKEQEVERAISLIISIKILEKEVAPISFLSTLRQIFNARLDLYESVLTDILGDCTSGEVRLYDSNHRRIYSRGWVQSMMAELTSIVKLRGH